MIGTIFKKLAGAILLSPYFFWVYIMAQDANEIMERDVAPLLPIDGDGIIIISIFLLLWLYAGVKLLVE